MLGRTFYYSLTRKYVSLFGNLFNDIVIRRFDANNNQIQTLPVPIRYGPRQKWLALLAQHPQDTEVAVQLPRIGFELMGFQYESNRAKNPLNKLVTVTDDKNKLISQFYPRPFKLNFKLSIMAKNMDDASQIMEQIVPYFTPDFSIPATLIPGMNEKFDLAVTMSPPNLEDAYGEDFISRRVLMISIDFNMDAFFFGPKETQGVIKRVQVDLHAVPGLGSVTSSDIQTSGRDVRIVVTPGLTANGTPTNTSNNSINYLLVDADDDYGFVTEVYDFYDGKKYSPVLGTDI